VCVRVHQFELIFLGSGEDRRRAGDVNWCRSEVPPLDVSRRVRRGGTSGCGNGERGLVIHQVAREGGGSGQYRMLTKTNYYAWVALALMRINLQARSLWTTVNIGTSDFIDDCNALKTHLGVDGVRQAMANSCGANSIRSSSRTGSPSTT